MTQWGKVERATLERGLKSVRPLLEARGFTCSEEHQGSSSGGPFATVTFRCGPLEIGLIVRHKTKLGCPNYNDGKGYVSHTELIQALGREGDEQLVPRGDWASNYEARQGGDAFDALRSDWEQMILPALDESREQFCASLARAIRRRKKKRGR